MLQKMFFMLPSMYVHVTFQNGFIYKKKHLQKLQKCKFFIFLLHFTPLPKQISTEEACDSLVRDNVYYDGAMLESSCSLELLN